MIGLVRAKVEPKCEFPKNFIKNKVFFLKVPQQNPLENQTKQANHQENGQNEAEDDEEEDDDDNALKIPNFSSAPENNKDEVLLATSFNNSLRF